MQTVQILEESLPQSETQQWAVWGFTVGIVIVSSSPMNFRWANLSVPWLSTIYCHKPSFLSDVSWIIDITFLKLFLPFVFFNLTTMFMTWTQCLILGTDSTDKNIWFEESEESKVCECDWVLLWKKGAKHFAKYVLAIYLYSCALVFCVFLPLLFL